MNLEERGEGCMTEFRGREKHCNYFTISKYENKRIKSPYSFE